ncbi:MAG: hypothetical protein KME06_09445 [Kastovskya adunca ATA6-11-RM4]|jgi:hypothetical protein|nr:hypothetical protein [Kastovskya adunca ATA6-11-RM4]
MLKELKTSRSPFKDRVNATLTFQVPTAQMGSDSRGNPVPVTESLTVHCYFKPDNRPRELFFPGIGEKEEPMIGYAVLPMQLPASIKDGAIAQAEVGELKGKFTLKRQTLPIPEFEREAGTKFHGIFTRQV